MIEVERIDQGNRIVFRIKGTYDLHREDGPAIIWQDGTKAWYIDGEKHREDGPAIEWSNGKKEWYLYGECYSSKERWFEALSEEKRAKALYSEYFIGG